ncbi:UDP-3-O-acylglucosamine N-acyltransferase [Elysia marginata]|uniref:UDP-3-O-acylglucosamine N-acyltransferase n=1 Tax=Elysia marginata TaxID=1093978 RepID=A0AAV4GFV3_9GAST|nr:UDP-3-O-acylglucosamine N-acyltransferase [Elysia marginata]
MKFSLQQVAEAIGGFVEGDGALEVSQLAKIEDAKEGSISFLSNPKYTNFIYTTGATAVIVNKDFVPQKPLNLALIRVLDPRKAFTDVLSFYNESKLKSKVGIEEPSHIGACFSKGENLYLGAFAYIGDHVTVGDNVKIFPNTFIGENVTIGNNTIIYPSVSIYPDTIIGDNCVIDSSTVIGSDGFGYIPNEEGVYDKIPHIGNVEIGNNVSIGASVTIDKSTIGHTIIGDGVKLDNQIHVAHNVAIGKHTVIAAQTGIAGSVRVGKYCRIGGQVGLLGHINIGDKVNIQAQSGVAKNQEDGARIQGMPAFDYNSFNRSYVYFKKLPELLGNHKK